MNAHAKPSKEKKTGFHRLWMSATLALMTLTTMGHMLLPTSQSQVAQAAALPARQGNITVYVQDKAGAVPSGRGRGTSGSNQLRLCPAGRMAKPPATIGKA